MQNLFIKLISGPPYQYAKGCFRVIHIFWDTSYSLFSPWALSLQVWGFPKRSGRPQCGCPLLVLSARAQLPLSQAVGILYLSISFHNHMLTSRLAPPVPIPTWAPIPTFLAADAAFLTSWISPIWTTMSCWVPLLTVRQLPVPRVASSGKG